MDFQISIFGMRMNCSEREWISDGFCNIRSYESDLSFFDAEEQIAVF